MESRQVEMSSFRCCRDRPHDRYGEPIESRFPMKKIVRTEIQASGGVKDHNVRYVLGGSVAFVVLAMIIIFALR